MKHRLAAGSEILKHHSSGRRPRALVRQQYRQSLQANVKWVECKNHSFYIRQTIQGWHTASARILKCANSEHFCCPIMPREQRRNRFLKLAENRELTNYFQVLQSYKKHCSLWLKWTFFIGKHNKLSLCCLSAIYLGDWLHLHSVILQTLLSKATYNWGIHKVILLKEAKRHRQCS